MEDLFMLTYELMTINEEIDKLFYSPPYDQHEFNSLQIERNRITTDLIRLLIFRDKE